MRLIRAQRQAVRSKDHTGGRAMINTKQFDLAQDLWGGDRARAHLFDALDAVEHLIGALNPETTDQDAVADTLHRHLNTLTALGATELATKVVYHRQ